MLNIEFCFTSSEVEKRTHYAVLVLTSFELQKDIVLLNCNHRNLHIHI